MGTDRQTQTSDRQTTAFLYFQLRSGGKYVRKYQPYFESFAKTQAEPKEVFCSKNTTCIDWYSKENIILLRMCQTAPPLWNNGILFGICFEFLSVLAIDEKSVSQAYIVAQFGGKIRPVRVP